MPAGLANYIIEYGYLSIFLLVFLQEIGIPSFPNELLLLYTGYLAYKGILNIFLVLLIVVSADISGSFALYILFYCCSAFLIQHRPKWMTVPYKKIRRLKIQMRNEGGRKIFFGRLIPFLRGYVAVVAGMLRINMKSYVSMILLSALVWSGGYVMIGWLAGPFCNALFERSDYLKNYIIILPVVLILIFSVKWGTKKQVLKNI